MARVLIIIGICCFVYTSCIVSADLECRDDQTEVDCPGYCSADYCPKEDGESCSCPQPSTCPAPACKCRFNSRLSDDNSTCINTRDCPAFPCTRENEEFNPCPPICPTDSCDQATPDGRCPLPGRIGIVLECCPKCRCIKGYWRNDSGECVPYAQCPGKGNETSTDPSTDPLTGPSTDPLSQPDPSSDSNDSLSTSSSSSSTTSQSQSQKNNKCKPPKGNTCGANEEYTSSRSSCLRDTCVSIISRYSCYNETFAPGCVCKGGYLRRAEDSKCVPICQCPEMSTALECQKRV